MKWLQNLLIDAVKEYSKTLESCVFVDKENARIYGEVYENSAHCKFMRLDISILKLKISVIKSFIKDN